MYIAKLLLLLLLLLLLITYYLQIMIIQNVTTLNFTSSSDKFGETSFRILNLAHLNARNQSIISYIKIKKKKKTMTDHSLQVI